jgi:hypothetical protein
MTRTCSKVKWASNKAGVKHATAPMKTSQGKKRLMSPLAFVNFHPFTNMLQEWEEGAPVDCGEDWTQEMIDAAMHQGPHKSALTPEAMALVKEDVAYQVQARYAQVVEWDWLKENLRGSPATEPPWLHDTGSVLFGVVAAQKGKRRKRKRNKDDVIQESVNDMTAQMAPEVPTLIYT